MGLSSSEGSVMQKERCADCRSRISAKSVGVRSSVARARDSVSSAEDEARCDEHCAEIARASEASAGCVRMISFSMAFSRSSSATCCWRLSKKNFFRSRVRRARILFRSRRLSICACVLCLCPGAAGAGAAAFSVAASETGAGAGALPASSFARLCATSGALTLPSSGGATSSTGGGSNTFFIIDPGSPWPSCEMPSVFTTAASTEAGSSFFGGGSLRKLASSPSRPSSPSSPEPAALS
mmetsp:Transcript_17664/g.55295  ORF Transcript_17664/g.55295 Transcript_17664/m.55295 type:complete len:239 (-) Transcript_17664:440-1156(-)